MKMAESQRYLDAAGIDRNVEGASIAQGDDKETVRQKLTQYLDENKIEQIEHVNAEFMVIATKETEKIPPSIKQRFDDLELFINYLAHILEKAPGNPHLFIHFRNNSDALILYGSLVPPEYQNRATRVGRC